MALAAVFAGIVLLLLLGTQILQWPWLALLAALGLILSILRVRRQLVGGYAVAQMVDRRLQLSDSLSTAWYLLGDLNTRSAPLAAGQIARAEEAAGGVDPSAVFPFVWQRAWGLTGALAMVALGLFAVRYLVTSSLDLRQALIPLHMPSWAEVVERFAEPRTRFEAKRLPEQALAEKRISNCST